MRLWYKKFATGRLMRQMLGLDIHPDFVKKAVELLPAEPWDKETWKIWTGAVASATEKKNSVPSITISVDRSRAWP